MNQTRTTSDVFRAKFLTIPAAVAPTAAAARSVFAELAARVNRSRILPIQEKVYGPIGSRDTVLHIRREEFTRAGLDPDLPCTYTAGRAGDDLGFGGVQLWGISPKRGAPVSVRTVRTAGKVRTAVTGRLLEAPDQRLLYLADVGPRDANGVLPDGVAAQGAQMFENADAGLREFGFRFGDVARTWIYLARVLDWYGEFNRVRYEFLRARGITDDTRFPASTGIQGTGGAGECLMDVLAVTGDGARIRAITDSSRQRRPMSYGSSFSRAVAVPCGGEELVFVSGTASIDSTGRTLHCWQREAQVLETLLSVAALLEDQGAGLTDIVLATLFCKDRETLQVFQRVSRQLVTARLPVIPVLADVCRSELMVEIEAMALVPRPRTPSAGTPPPGSPGSEENR